MCTVSEKKLKVQVYSLVSSTKRHSLDFTWLGFFIRFVGVQLPNNNLHVSDGVHYLYCIHCFMDLWSFLMRQELFRIEDTHGLWEAIVNYTSHRLLEELSNEQLQTFFCWLVNNSKGNFVIMYMSTEVCDKSLCSMYCYVLYGIALLCIVLYCYIVLYFIVCC